MQFLLPYAQEEKRPWIRERVIGYLSFCSPFPGNFGLLKVIGGHARCWLAHFPFSYPGAARSEWKFPLSFRGGEGGGNSAIIFPCSRKIIAEFGKILRILRLFSERRSLLGEQRYAVNFSLISASTKGRGLETKEWSWWWVITKGALARRMILCKPSFRIIECFGTLTISGHK